MVHTAARSQRIPIGRAGIHHGRGMVSSSFSGAALPRLLAGVSHPWGSCCPSVRVVYSQSPPSTREANRSNWVNAMACSHNSTQVARRARMRLPRAFRSVTKQSSAPWHGLSRRVLQNDRTVAQHSRRLDMQSALVDLTCFSERRRFELVVRPEVRGSRINEQPISGQPRVWKPRRIQI